MKILHVITTLVTGGAERLMVDLLPKLRDKGDEVDLLLFNGLRTPFREELEQKGVTVYELTNQVGNIGHTEVYNPLNILKLCRYMRKYDIIHTHNTACQVYVPIARKLTWSNVALATTEHNTTGRRRTKKWFRAIDKWVYSQYSAIICIADQVRDNLVQHIDRENGVVTIYNGIDTNRFIGPIKDISGQKEFVITMVARFRPQKDQDTLLKTMTILPDNYRLQFVGEGKRENEIKAMCGELGLDERVVFLGVRMDVPEILRNSDIAVLSSHWEGFGLSAVEAMAAGIPFIASDVDGLREIVSGAGIIFPQGDEVTLAKKIQNLCENPVFYRETATACQERAKQYDISVMAEGYHQLYQSLMAGKR